MNILQPGPGVGGHCIAVDPWFVVSSSPQVAKLIRAARDVNDSKPGWVLERSKQWLQIIFLLIRLSQHAKSKSHVLELRLSQILMTAEKVRVVNCRVI